mmetsp:Transcript_33230/g.69911  ORF Transcript_33230/g.69911 Transcript_33230/m.69911 type:complete len:204 (+) Transcript_33230:164-775(+)
MVPMWHISSGDRGVVGISSSLSTNSGLEVDGGSSSNSASLFAPSSFPSELSDGISSEELTIRKKSRNPSLPSEDKSPGTTLSSSSLLGMERIAANSNVLTASSTSSLENGVDTPDNNSSSSILCKMSAWLRSLRSNSSDGIDGSSSSVAVASLSLRVSSELAAVVVGVGSSFSSSTPSFTLPLWLLSKLSKAAYASFVVCLLP